MLKRALPSSASSERALGFASFARESALLSEDCGVDRLRFYCYCGGCGGLVRRGCGFGVLIDMHCKASGLWSLPNIDSSDLIF